MVHRTAFQQRCPLHIGRRGKKCSGIPCGCQVDPYAIPWGYQIDPCGCQVDPCAIPCGYQIDPCGCQVDPCAIPCGYQIDPCRNPAWGTGRRAWGALTLQVPLRPLLRGYTLRRSHAYLGGRVPTKGTPTPYLLKYSAQARMAPA